MISGRKVVGAVGRFIWRWILPFGAVRHTVSLVKKEVTIQKKNVQDLGKMAVEIRELAKFKEPSADAEVGFEEALANRTGTPLSILQLKRYFLQRKRVALLGMFLTMTISLLGVVMGLSLGHGRSLLFSGVSFFIGGILCFGFAMAAQHRLWQLETRRLSHAERGGLADFKREQPNWIWLTLSPTYSFSSEPEVTQQEQEGNGS